MSLKPGRVELHVEELVLHGFEPGDRYRVGDAVERELARLLAEHGVPGPLERGGQIERLDAGTLHLPSGAGGRTIGVHVARVVFGGLAR